MSKTEQGQVSGQAAQIYEEFFVPALFQEWAPRLADAAGVARGMQVLDVACGTGVLTRELAKRVGQEGSVIGLDLNEGMLSVARAKTPSLTWYKGRAEVLPFKNDSFDVVTCQFGLMFFEDRTRALRSMLRVLRPGGRLVVAVWDTLAHTPGYINLSALLDRLFGRDVAASLDAPYCLGNTVTLAQVFEDAGINNIKIQSQTGMARFPSMEDWIYTDVKGWTAAELIDEKGLERLTHEAKKELSDFVQPDGSVAFSAPAHLVTVLKQ